jgi:hypothetical protein
MKDDMQYAVYLHEGAIAALGEAITPYLSQGPHGPHFLCHDLDTGGALCEMIVDVPGTDGHATQTEVMVPIAMIRLVLSTGIGDDPFGFRGAGKRAVPAG